jgi:hypothetical protein
LDVCEIGSRIHERGSVVQVKVLGTLGLIDEGEADWKIIAIDVNDPIADKLNDINDVHTHCPGLLEATRDWFRIYKIPTGKPANQFALDGKFFDREFALKTIQHDHDSWSHLISGGYDAEPDKKKGISLVNTQLGNTGALRVSSDDAATAIHESTPAHVSQPAFIDTLPIDTVHFVKL